MKLIEVDPAVIPNLKYAKHKVEDVIHQFAISKSRAAQLIYDEGEYCSVSSIQSTYMKAIKRLGYNHIRVISSEGKVYMYKEEANET